MEDIRFVRAEGGILMGSFVLKRPIELDDAKCNARSRRGGGESGAAGSFTLPCELNGVVVRGCGAAIAAASGKLVQSSRSGAANSVDGVQWY